MKLEISKISNLGHGVAVDTNGKKIFIPKTVTGDIVEAKLVKENSKLKLGEVVEVIKESKYRQKAECEYFNDCGGCTLQHLKKEFYQEFKRNNIIELLTKRG